MARYIDANALYERTAEWEASAFAYVESLNRTPLEEMDEDEKSEWHRWTAILGERSAFKHDVADAPTIDAVEVVRCKECKHSIDDKLFGGLWCQHPTEKHCERYADFYCGSGERREE